MAGAGVNDTTRLPATEWHGCYGDGWQGEIVPEAFTHPAKVSRALIRRIYQHAFVEGRLLPGDVCCDPFGGIGGTALDAMWNGLTWIGCELEPKFVALGQQNLDLWARKYGSKPGFGSARILQGDSRNLRSVIASADLVCSSPPYAGDSGKSDRTGHERAARRAEEKGLRQGLGCFKTSEAYGNAPGQLGAMREGTAPALICASPPYAAISTGAGGLNTKPGANGQQSGRNAAAPSQDTDQRYGETAGQLATSPPYEAGAEGQVKASKFRDPVAFAAGMAARSGHGNNHAQSPEARAAQFKRDLEKHYGDTEGNIGNQTGDTFWQAAREIVAQCHAILRPGGHAIWITKDFVRKGKRIPFSDQWQALCEQQGFRLVCRHRAMLVVRHGEQDSIFGGSEQITTQRKSFFRRLAERKGSPAIDWEDVICLQRTEQFADVTA